MLTEKLESTFWEFLAAISPAVAQWLSIEDNELLMFMEPQAREYVREKFDKLTEQVRTIAVAFPYSMVDEQKPPEG